MWHKSGLWNTLWTDMMIETTLMKTGKSPGGLKGVTLKPELVKKWAFSLNTFGKIDVNLRNTLRMTVKFYRQIHTEGKNNLPFNMPPKIVKKYGLFLNIW